MASQSLYRKWRSQTFSDMVGQEPVIRTLKNALNSGNLAHAYLFTGPRGTGKTTTARLLAKTINCTNPRDGEPCNDCEQCREITVGSSFNVIEIDAASNRGIDSIRELREKVMMPPATGKYKVYILDEAHMLTVEAFNALLKTLEEPPPHAIFVMATTDVHKMLPTVLSRCQRFDFKRFTMRQTVQHLNFVAEQEHIKLEAGAAELLARAAAGGMRDALSLLDQAIAYSGQEIALAQVQTMLGVADPRAIQKLIAHVAQMDSAGGLHLIHELAEAGADLRQINTQVAEYWRAMMLVRAGANIALILDSTDEEIKEITQTAQHFDLEELTECARVFAQNDLMQKGQGTPQLGLELALLTCIELHRRAQSGQNRATHTPEVVQTRPMPVQEASRPQVPTSPRPQAPVHKAPIVPQETVPQVSPPQLPPIKVSEEPASAEELPDWDAIPHPDESEEPEPSTSVSATPEPVVPSHKEQTSDVPAFTLQDVKEKWEYIKRRVKTKKDGAMLAALLNSYAVVSVEGTKELPIIAIKAGADFHYNSIYKSDERVKIIEWAVKVELGQTCKVRILPPHYAGTGSGVHVPPPPDPVNHSSHSTMVVAPQQSARRERPAASLPPPQVDRVVKSAKKQEVPTSTAPTTVLETNLPVPLVKTNGMRDNTHTTSSTKAQTTGETRQSSIEKKAKSDPVVKKAVEMFKADIKEIQMK